MASDAGNFWEYIGRFRTFPYFHSIIFVVNYKMNIISSHKMYIISPSVTRAAVRGWFWVLGCSSDMSGCIHWDWYWYPGDCIRSSATSEAILPWPSVAELRHRPRITSFWGSFCEPSINWWWRLHPDKGWLCHHQIPGRINAVTQRGWREVGSKTSHSLNENECWIVIPQMQRHM